MPLKKSIIACVLLFLLPPITAGAQELSVRIIEREPFVVKDGERYTGFSIDLWEAIANDNNWSYTYENTDSFIELLRGPKEGTVDVAIANISISSDREEVMDFSSAIFDSGLQVMAQKNRSIDLLLDALRIPQGRIILAFLALFLMVAAHIMWISERERREVISQRYIPGVLEALWWTVTLGGFGRALPLSGPGRFTLLLWMFVQTISVALYVSAISTMLTAHNLEKSINTYHDLQGKKVGTTQGSVAESFLREQRIDVLLYRDTQSLFDDVATGYLDAAVHDFPLVQYYIAQDGKKNVRAVGNIFQRDVYGIAVPTGRALLSEIDVSLLRLRENGVYDEIYAKWFGSREK